MLNGKKIHHFHNIPDTKHWYIFEDVETYEFDYYVYDDEEEWRAEVTKRLEFNDSLGFGIGKRIKFGLNIPSKATVETTRKVKFV